MSSSVWQARVIEVGRLQPESLVLIIQKIVLILGLGVIIVCTCERIEMQNEVQAICIDNIPLAQVV